MISLIQHKIDTSTIEVNEMVSSAKGNLLLFLIDEPPEEETLQKTVTLFEEDHVGCVNITDNCFLIKKSDFLAVDGLDSTLNFKDAKIDLQLKIYYHLNKVNLNLVSEIETKNVSEKLMDRWGDLLSEKQDTQINQNKDITFIVCTNNISQLNKILVKSLQPFRERMDLIVVYNLNGKYSAAQALNLGMAKAKTDWLVLTHQDVEYSKNWVDVVFLELQRLPKVGVAGLAGVRVSSNTEKDVSRLNPNLYVKNIGRVKNSDLVSYSRNPSGEVDVIDELCVITRKSHCLNFDEKVLTHFHFYAVDLSLQAKQRGYKNYVLSAEAIHHSNGASSLKTGKDLYLREFKKLHEKWKNIFPTLATTTGFWVNGQIHTTLDDFKPEEGVLPTTQVRGASTAIKLQILQNESVELIAEDLGSWFVDGIEKNNNSKNFVFKPVFQGLHKITHQGKNISEWWIQTVKVADLYTVGMCQSFHTHQLGEIFGRKTVSQEIICDRSGLAKIELFLGTFRRKNECRLSLHIESHGVVVRSTYLYSSKIRDNDWNEFTFLPIEESKNQKYTLKIFSPDAKQGNAVTAYFVNHSFPFGNLFQNDRKLNGTLSFKLSYLINI
jgi:hypothetical protein